MADIEVHDSTDWLSTPLAGLTDVEASLRCQVCKDFYKTPMITSCSHTFCSLCIRRALSHDGKCPLCRAGDQELKLRSNWSMEETVEAFTKARPKVLEVARNPPASAKRKAQTEDTKEAKPEPKRLRTSARLNSRTPNPPPQQEEEEEKGVEDVVEVADSDGGDTDGEYAPETENHDGLVPCPICSTKMKEWQVFAHLENCTGAPPPTPKTTKNGAFPLQQQTAPKAAERLPAINYSMLKDNALRKKLTDLGLSTIGSRTLLEKRHKEWITLWNANCDAAKPKKRTELMRDLDMWERTQGGKAPMGGRSIREAAVIKDKDFDGQAWATKHEDSFKDLIESARQNRKKTTGPSAEQIPSQSTRLEDGPEKDNIVNETVTQAEGEHDVMGTSEADRPNGGQDSMATLSLRDSVNGGTGVSKSDSLPSEQVT